MGMTPATVIATEEADVAAECKSPKRSAFSHGGMIPMRRATPLHNLIWHASSILLRNVVAKLARKYTKAMDGHIIRLGKIASTRM